MKKKSKSLPKTSLQFFPSASTGSLGLLIPIDKETKVIPLTNNGSLRLERLNTSSISSGKARYAQTDNTLIGSPDTDLDFNYQANTSMHTLVTVQTKRANAQRYY